MKVKFAVLALVLSLSACAAHADSFNVVTASATFTPGGPGAFDVSFDWDATTNTLQAGTLSAQGPFGALTLSAINLDKVINFIDNSGEFFQIDFMNIGDGGSFDAPGTYSGADMDLNYSQEFWPRASGQVTVNQMTDPVNTPEAPVWLLSLAGILSIGIFTLVKK